MTSSASDSGDEFIEMKIDKGSKEASVSSFVISVSQFSYRGLPKKRSPLQKWHTWFIMAINKENVDKSCVFVLHRYLCVRTNNNCNSYLNNY